MPYLTSVSQEQVGRGPASGTVRVHWTFGNLIPDVVEVRKPGDTVTPPTLLASVPINAGAKTPTSTDFIVAAPNLLSLAVSPRTVENETFTDKMVDDSGVLQPWETFSHELPLLAVAPEQPPPPIARSKPTIVNVDVGDGVLTVHWTSPAVDVFNATLIPSIIPFQGQIELAGSDRSFTQNRVTQGRYRFSIQGCTEGIRRNCSDWVGIDIVMPPELGFQPWRRPFPIAPGGFAHRGAVTSVARTPDHLDVFWVGADGNISSTFWD